MTASPRWYKKAVDLTPIPASFRAAYIDPESGKWLEDKELDASGAEISVPIESKGSRNGEAEIGDAWLTDFLKYEFPAVGWLIEPMLPQGGVVFLHGPTSAGKSPFTWALATAVSEGTPFGGYPVSKAGPVLYIELDTPASLIQPRLRKLRVIPGRMWLAVFPRAIDICDPDERVAARLVALRKKVKPVLVIINTLRKAHDEEDKDSGAPKRVYGAWQAYFPTATLFFVHHDKKTPTQKDIVVDEDQMFGGSMHWANDAQVAFHLMRAKKQVKKDEKGKVVAAEPAEYQKTPIIVKMTKSQVSDHERFPPLQMRLEPDGTNWVDMGPAAYRTFYQSLPVEVPKARRIAAVMAEFDVGKSAVYDAVGGMR